MNLTCSACCRCLQYKQLQRALRLKAELRQVVASTQYSQMNFDDDASGSSVESIIFDNNGFWSQVINVLKVASPIMKLLFMCDNQPKELMGKVYYHMFMIGDKLDKLSGSIPWAMSAKEMHAARWEYIHSKMHAAGYALDPEYLYSGDGNALDVATMQGLMEVVERLSLRHIIQRAVDPNQAAKVLTLESVQVQEHGARAMEQFSSFRNKEGVFTKGMVIASAKSLPPSQWWSLYGGHLPELQAIACSVLKQPVSACAAERNWSVYGQIKTAARNRMAHSVADKRVYCHEALHLQEKLQNAAYRMPMQKWEDASDSDSNEESETEADATAIAKLVA